MSAVRGQSALRPPSGNGTRRVTPGKIGKPSSVLAGNAAASAPRTYQCHCQQVCCTPCCMLHVIT
eukprot:4003351-Alexandrium_andersonii.AAC.1